MTPQLWWLPGVAVALATAGALHGYSPQDVEIGRFAANLLMDGNLHLYALVPAAQMGPLALLLIGLLPRAAYLMVVCGLYGVFLHLAETTWRGRVDLGWRMLVSVLAGPLWGLLAVTGHGDDALVLVGSAGVVAALHHRRPGWGAAAVVVAVVAKPTGLVLLPLLLLFSWPTLAVAVGVSAVAWLPFIVPDVDAFLSAGKGIAWVQPGSLADFLGSGWYDPFPWWVRPVQLAGALILTGLVARHVGPAPVLVAAAAWRTILEPATWPVGTALLLLLALLLVSHRAFLLATGLGALAWAVSWIHPLTAAGGALRLCLLLLAGGAALVVAQAPEREKAPRHPLEADDGALARA